MTEFLVTINRVSCCYENCGVVFGIEAAHQGRLRDTHAWFYCPNGHQQHYSGESDAEKARREAAGQKKNAEYYMNRLAEEQGMRRKTERRVLAYQGHLGKLKKRIANGVCPCCKRSFVGLARHIKTQHPDYSNAEFVMPGNDERVDAPAKAASKRVTA